MKIYKYLIYILIIFLLLINFQGYYLDKFFTILLIVILIIYFLKFKLISYNSLFLFSLVLIYFILNFSHLFKFRDSHVLNEDYEITYTCENIKYLKSGCLKPEGPYLMEKIFIFSKYYKYISLDATDNESYLEIILNNSYNEKDYIYIFENKMKIEYSPKIDSFKLLK